MKKNEYRAKIVSNSKREIVDLGTFLYLYIPLTPKEIENVDFDDNLCGHPAWRIRVKKDPGEDVPDAVKSISIGKD